MDSRDYAPRENENQCRFQFYAFPWGVLVSTRFDRDTAIQPISNGLYQARLDPGWWIRRGPNGGYVAAILLRALQHAVADPARPPRSVTIHYLRPPAEGPCQIQTTLDRTGRTLTTASARLLQGDRLLALAVSAFATPRPSPDFQHAIMPEVPPPESIEPLSGPAHITMRARYEYRPAFGAPMGAHADRAEAGGWIRLAEPRPVDAPLLAAYSDCWPPSVFTHLDPESTSRGIPTIDLTVHFRSPFPLPGATAEDFTFLTFHTRTLREGFLEEDGNLWSRDGQLLAQSRQLAILS